MSAILTPINNNIVQVGVYSDGDTYTHIRAGSVYCTGISCDTAAELPAQSGGITGYYLEQGSAAHVIEDNSVYVINALGTWIKQETSPYNDVYTKSEVDVLLAPINQGIDDIVDAQTEMQTEIAGMINDGAKNIVNITAISGTHNGVVCTIEPDKSVTLSGISTGYYSFRICGVSGSNTYADAIPIPRGKYILTGCDGNASPTTSRYILGLFAASDSTRVSTSIYGNYEFEITTDSARFDLSVYFATGANFTNPIAHFYPMIAKKWKWDITQEFVPYSPTNAELAALIKSYHP